MNRLLGLILLSFVICATLDAKNVSVNETPQDHASKMDLRVINGADLPEGRLPFIVSIRGDDPERTISNYCGGTLVHPEWVMTAAHCFIASTSDGKTFENPSLWHIQAGSTNIDLNWGHGGSSKNLFSKILGILGSSENEGNKESKPIHVHATKIFLHPKYKSTDLEWDIALMKLDRPLREYPKVDTAYLPPKPKNINANRWPERGTRCFLAGWGCTKANGHAVSKAQYAQFNVMVNSKCSDIYQHGADLNDDHEFCAGFHNEDVGICPGDSGSGLFCKSEGKWVVEGIASATHRRNPESYPGIFTRVSYFRDWLEEIVTNN